MALPGVTPTTVVVDATHIFGPNTPTWPEKGRMMRCPAATYESDGYFCESYVVAGGSGTHMDSPAHMLASGKSISDLDASLFLSPLVLVDVTKKCELDPNYALTPDDLLEWEAAHGKIPAGAFVAMKTGWHTRWHSEAAFRNTDKEGVMRFPAFSGPAAQFLVSERDIHGIGVDTLSLDIGASVTFEVHRIILGAGLYQVENLNLGDSRIPAAGAHILTLPAKIQGAPEAPTRAIVLM